MLGGKQLKVKDDKSDYIIYHPYPCKALPPIGSDIPEEGCQCVSIDPAIVHFAIRIEKRYRTRYVETIYMNKIDFTEYDDASENGTTKVNPQILEACTNLLLSLMPLMLETRIIGIERQMGINYKSSRIFQHVLTFFRLMVTQFKYYCVIMDISPKLKTRIFGAPKKMSYHDGKKWSIEKALQFSSWRNDTRSIQIINQHRGKTKTKGDDLADTIVQMEALFMLLGGITTPEPQEIFIPPSGYTLVQGTQYVPQPILYYSQISE